MVTFVTYICKMPTSGHAQGTGYPDVYRGFAQFLEAKTFATLHSLISLSFDTL
jgi:hypothetical protein